MVEDLDADWLLALVEESEVQSRAADRRKLRHALAWSRLHPAQGLEEAATWGDAGGRDRDCDLTLDGEGAPLVAAFTAEPFAVALGVSTRAGMRLIADALDLAYRLPHAHALVESLKVAPWRARKLAEATRGLTQQAAACVDREIAPVLDSCGPTRIDRLVEEARARFDPVEQSQEEDGQQAGWGIQLRYGPSGRFAGTSWLEITGDTPTLTRFHDLAATIAHDLLDPDDPAGADLDHRKVAAVGVILERALGSTDADPSSGDKTKLFLHLDSDTLLDPTTGVGHLVILRDRRCVYPYCERDSRGCDLDHIDSYLDLGDGGPPGQTHPDNLAPLCRGHHRAKTHGSWTYQRHTNGTYTWHTPHGRTLIVWPDGTVNALG